MASSINVQFSDSTESTITSCFGSVQDPSVYPNQAAILSSDSRYETWYNALPPIIKAIGGIVAPGA